MWQIDCLVVGLELGLGYDGYESITFAVTASTFPGFWLYSIPKTVVAQVGSSACYILPTIIISTLSSFVTYARLASELLTVLQFI